MGGPSGNKIKQAIIDERPQSALKSIKLKDYGTGDAVLFYLEKGNLLRLAGHYEESQNAFESAKEKIEDLYTVSVSKNAASILVNDNVTDYKGDYFEYVMLHIYQVLSYLETGDIENAGVIARQLDVILTELENSKLDSNGKVYKCDPYANYLSGLIFEGLNRWSSARIKYEKAYQCYKNSIYKISIPQQVKRALLRASKKSGAMSLFRQYSKKFNVQEKQRIKSELIVILDEGFIAAKREVSVAVTAYSDKRLRQLKIAMPEIPQDNTHLISEVRIKINNKVSLAEKVHDLDSAARVSLNERSAGIKSRAIARAIKNQALQNDAEQNGNFIAKFGSVILSNILEQADIRGWNSLPHTVWMSRTPVEAGTYDVELQLIDNSGYVIEHKRYTNVLLRAKEKKNLYFRWGALQNKKKDIKGHIILPLL